MMDLLLQRCKLIPQQKNLLSTAINKGKSNYKELMAKMPETITDKYVASLQYDLVNEAIRQAVDSNKDLNLEVIKLKAGGHPYIAVRDNIRNISIVICRLPASRQIFAPSKYRGEFSQTNFDKLIQLGVPEELLTDTEYQQSLNLAEDNIPFGIIVYYDRYKDIIFEGALKPSQNDWIYKEKLTYVSLENIITPEEIITPTITEENNIPLSFNNIFESDEDIEINLKI